MNQGILVGKLFHVKYSQQGCHFSDFSQNSCFLLLEKNFPAFFLLSNTGLFSTLKYLLTVHPFNLILIKTVPRSLFSFFFLSESCELQTINTN